MHACMYVCMYVCMYACMHVCACMYACMHVCMHVCMYCIMFVSCTLESMHKLSGDNNLDCNINVFLQFSRIHIYKNGNFSNKK